MAITHLTDKTFRPLRTATSLVSLCFGAWLGLSVSIGPLSAQEGGSDFPEIAISGFVDGRLIRASGEQSWLDNGLGKTRYGASATGGNRNQITLAEAALILEPRFSWDLTGMIHLQYSPEQSEAIDIVEAFLKYKPLSLSSLRFSGRLGLMYPPISLEHTDIGWTSPYSLTPSAINAWVGEEVKALSAEASFEKRLSTSTLSLVAAAFMSNDPTTALFAWRGWAMHDQKLSYFQRYPLPAVATLSDGGVFFERQALWTEPHHEYDNKPGYYVGLNWDHLGLVRVKALYYDNRGEPSVVENKQYAWDVRFWSFGATAAPVDGVELLAQVMMGNTKMGPLIGAENVLNLDFSSFYLMASYSLDAHRISARFDHFQTDEQNTVASFIDNDNETGNAFTLAYSFTPFDGHRVMAEWLRIDSRRNNRPDIGRPVRSKENQFQLSYRFAF